MRLAAPERKGVVRLTRQEELLLRSALLPGKNGRDNWRELRPALDLDHLPPGQASLLTLVSRNAGVLGADEPETPRLKGLYRLTWYANEALFHRLASVLNLFGQAGIDALVLGDVPLVVQYYQDSGLRAVEAVDLLVAGEKAPAAIELLKGAGFFPRQHAIEFTDGRRPQPDVRWRLISDSVADAGWYAGDFWEAAVPITVAGARARAPNAADQLLLLCVDGPRLISTLRWVADTLMIVRAAGRQLDWDRLIAQGKKRRAILPITRTLASLPDSLGVSVPREVLGHLDGLRPDGREVLAFRLSRLRGRLPRDLAQYVRLSAPWSLSRALIQLPRFLRNRWELDNTWQVPVQLGQRAVARIWRGLAGGRPVDRRPRDRTV